MVTSACPTSRWTALRPHVEQRQYWDSLSRFNVVPAGRRSGKTELAKRRGIRRALTPSVYPDFRVVFAAPTWAQAKRLYWRDIKSLIPRWAYAGQDPRRAVSESELTVRLVTGAEIAIAGLDRPERIEGSPIDHIVVDEIANCKASVWPEHIRPCLSERNGCADLIGVPEGRNHYWGLSQTAQEQQIERPDLWGFFTWFSADILPAGEIEIVRAELDERTFRQEFEGSFETFEGRVYYCFDRSTHAKEPQDYDPGAPLICCFDFNVRPGVASILQEREAWIDGHKGRAPRTLYFTRIIDEVWIADNSTTVRVCQEIVGRYRGHKGEVHVYGDATGGARGTAQVAGSDWDLVRAVLGPAFGDRLSMRVGYGNPPERVRINSVNSRLKSVNGSVWLTVDPRCTHTIEDFEGVVYKEGAGEINKTVNTKLTHLSDAIGYYITEKHPLGGYETVVEQM